MSSVQTLCKVAISKVVCENKSQAEEDSAEKVCRKSMEMETAREASEKFLRKLHREKINTYFEVTMFQTVGYGSIPIDTFLVG